MRPSYILLAILLLPIYAAADLFSQAADIFTPIKNQPLLESAMVQDMAQDDRGFLWFGTESGLYRYDGYEVKVYQHDAGINGSLPENFVSALWPSHGGKLWVATTSHLSLYNPRTDSFNSFSHDKNDPFSLAHNEITQLHGDSNGGLWIGTYAGADYLAPNSKKFIHHQHDPSDSSTIRSNEIQSFYRDSDGSLLIGTNKGISRLNPDRISFTDVYTDNDDPYSLKDNTVRSIYRDQLNKLWVGTHSQGIAWIGANERMHRFHPSHAKHSSLRTGQIWSIFQPNEKELWLSILGSGITVLNITDGKFLREMSPNRRVGTKLSSAHIKKMLLDKSGLLWLSQQGGRGGLSVYNTKNRVAKILYSTHKSDSSLSVTQITSLSKGQDGNLWTAGHGLNLISPQGKRLKLPSKWHQALDSESRAGNQVIGFAELKPGHFWAYQEGVGLISFSTQTKKELNFNSEKWGCREASQFLTLDSRTIAFACNDSPRVILFDTKTNRSETLLLDQNEDTQYSKINTLLLDKDNTLWIASEHGLYSLISSTELHIPTRKIRAASLGALAIHSLLLDEKANLWIDTQSGLFKKTNTTFVAVNNIKKLPDGNVFNGNMILDTQGRIWGNTGMLDLSQGHFFELESAEGYGLHLSRNNTSLNYHHNGETVLLIASLDGILTLKPENFLQRQYTPPLAITKLLINNKPNATALVNGLSLNRGMKSFAVDVAALDFLSPMKHKYRYQLSGHDEQWQLLSADDRRIRYSSLTPGDYELRIQHDNQFSSSAQQEIFIPLVVTPAWYQSLWFKAVLSILVTLFIYVTYYLRIRHLKAKRRQLYSLIDKQRLEIVQKNEQLETKRNELNFRKTELERKTQELDIQNDELRSRTNTLSDSLQELVLTQEHLIAQEKMASLGELVAGLAHEVNTPIGVSITAASHLGDKIKDLETSYKNGTMNASGLEKFLDNTFQSTDILLTNLLRSAELIQNFKNMSVDYSDEIEIEFCLHDCLSQIKSSLTPKVKQCGHTFNLTCDPNSPIKGKPGIISQVIVNLVMNAINHAFTEQESGEMILSVERRDEYYVLCFKDNGRGIEERHLSKIFDPFFTTNKQGGGTGLGLNIVHTLVTQNYGGSILCNSKMGSGTNFTITLPC